MTESAQPTALQPGDRYEFSYTVPVERTVPHLLPEAAEFSTMPEVFATGYMVAVVEWTCMQHLSAALPEDSLSLGTQVTLSHDAPTLPGMTVTVAVTLQELSDRHALWEVEARDTASVISRGTHRRGIVPRPIFDTVLARRSNV